MAYRFPNDIPREDIEDECPVGELISFEHVEVDESRRVHRFPSKASREDIEEEIDDYAEAYQIVVFLDEDNRWMTTIDGEDVFVTDELLESRRDVGDLILFEREENDDYDSGYESDENTLARLVRRGQMLEDIPDDW